ncbi:toll/interleukin-1 receptor domain-containing protein [uncultured Methanobrevibacter sp.]|uniref:toll/interleukin-1 receptor domain-containing protein n=1 Tax=uncultured Methanobrevibacter sp. TaxID=253161 RepID=UPI00261157CD|nr:toll/interleukin-1 receptor domain-containing protein [uncultured Methanobrevibacter sp.]
MTIKDFLGRIFKPRREVEEEIPTMYSIQPSVSSIYISYSTKDRDVADYVCGQLENRGFRCWIAPRNIIAGHPIDEQIYEAIKKTDCFLLIFSGNSQESKFVMRELNAAYSLGKKLISFHIDSSFSNREMEFYLACYPHVDGRELESRGDEIMDDLKKTLSYV